MVMLSQLINKRVQGSLFEQRARYFLEQQGLRFVAQNQYFRCGELDLVMQDQDTYVFIEVRQRKHSKFGTALESITFRKQQKWLKAANLWLAQRNLSLDTANCRFDVVVFESDQAPLWVKNFLG